MRNSVILKGDLLGRVVDGCDLGSVISGQDYELPVVNFIVNINYETQEQLIFRSDEDKALNCAKDCMPAHYLESRIG